MFQRCLSPEPSSLTTRHLPLAKSTVHNLSLFDTPLSSVRHVPVLIILYLFQVVVISEGLEDNFTLGLAALLGGDFAFLPHKTKLRKVAPVGWRGDSKKDAAQSYTFTLYLRVKFFMPSLRGVRYVSAASLSRILLIKIIGHVPHMTTWPYSSVHVCPSINPSVHLCLREAN